jgi:hypothetical protein
MQSVAEQQPLKLCVNCIHHSQHGHRYICHAPLMSLVTGVATPVDMECRVMRADKVCGPQGKLFEARSA